MPAATRPALVINHEDTAEPEGVGARAEGGEVVPTRYVLPYGHRSVRIVADNGQHVDLIVTAEQARWLAHVLQDPDSLPA